MRKILATGNDRYGRECIVMPAGRPTTFNPEYCDFVREHMAAGLSKTAVAGMLGTSRQTFINWCDANPEFLLTP